MAGKKPLPHESNHDDDFIEAAVRVPAGVVRACGTAQGRAGKRVHDDRAVVPQPGMAKDNSPAFQRWVSERKGNESREGRKNTRVLPHNFFRPGGVWTDLIAIVPAMNRWAIFGRPCGTFQKRR